MGSESRDQASIDFQIEGKSAVLVLSGTWIVGVPRPSPVDASARIKSISGVEKLSFDLRAISDWDSILLVFLRKCYDAAVEQGITVSTSDLPEGIRNLLTLSLAVPEQKSAEMDSENDWFTRVGLQTLRICGGLDDFFVFLGQFVIDCGAFVVGRARIKLRDFLHLLHETGGRALPIVALLNGLTGLIIAFIGVIQLQKFAADLYVADLVGLATTRELAAVITGVIMAGRTGAAFAAQIGSMQVNEEVDALQTFGVSPMQFLVLPRVYALLLMMPLLCVFANLFSMLGGYVVAVSIADISGIQYMNQLKEAVSLSDFFLGIFKSCVFGLIVAMAGCYRGLNCGRDAASVGQAATSAVVTAITWIVIADAIFAVIFQIIGI
ncbi:MAG: ABC transporter permease [Verrucomicrobiota bacterium]